MASNEFKGICTKKILPIVPSTGSNILLHISMEALVRLTFVLGTPMPSITGTVTIRYVFFNGA